MTVSGGFAARTFESMFRRGRLAHSFIIYGEKGLGKKETAMYMAKALLCEKNSGKPCGECRACKNAQARVHPDLIFPEKTGKLGTFSVKTCREVRSDCYVKPNDGERKVYLFEDCTDIQTPAQNAMLKIIEEPPDHAYFIFTAVSRDIFLPTVLSRVISLPAEPFTADECRKILSEREFDERQIKESMASFGTNVGMCVEYLENEQLRNAAALTKEAADSIINKDEYGFLKVAASPLMKDRSNALTVLRMLDDMVRDSAVLKADPDAHVRGCSRKRAELLSERLSASAAIRLHEYISGAAEDISANVNMSLIFSDLCGKTAEL